MTEKDDRKEWVDLMRGCCMLAILFFHTDCYYAGETLIPYVAYCGNALICFFVLSGYLFYKENQQFNYRHKLFSIAKGIILPYFIFTTLIAVPKTLIHGSELSASTLLYDIVTGQASWFISALAIAEILFSLLLWITRGKTAVLCLLCTVAFLIMVACDIQIKDFHTKYTFFWHWENALLMLIFMLFGYVYHQYEKVIHYFNLSRLILFSFVWIIIKYTECEYGLFLTIEPVHVSNYVLLLADGLLTTTLLIHFCKLLPPSKGICWVGRHSLVYYFICGGVPLTVSLLLQRINFGYEGHYYRVAIAFVAVCILATAITWAIYRYLPFMTGKSRSTQ